MAEIRVESQGEVIAKVRRLLELLNSEGLNIITAYLYGSWADCTPHEGSDIDVAVISTDLSGDRLEDWCLLNEMASRIDARMEVIGFRPERFCDEDPLAWEVKTKGIKLLI